MNLGNKILKIRKDNRMSQEEFAEKLNVTRQTVSNWENQKNYPDIETLVKISDMFATSLDILLKGDKKMIQDIDKKVKSSKLLKIAFLVLMIFVISSMSYSITRHYYKAKPQGNVGVIEANCIVDGHEYTITALSDIIDLDENLLYEKYKNMKPRKISIRELGIEQTDIKDKIGIKVEDYATLEDIYFAMKNYFLTQGGICTNYTENTDLLKSYNRQN